MATSFSPAGQQLLGNGTYGAAIPGAPEESDSDRRKRLQALQNAKNNLGSNSPYSPAGAALLGGDGYGACDVES
jgi:hypothetical protein